MYFYSSLLIKLLWCGFSFRIFTLRDKPEKFSEDTESDISTPVESDYQSVTSDTTSIGEDVIIEGELVM